MFDRDCLVKGLPLYKAALPGIPCQNVRGYLVHYALLELAESSEYRIGRMVLDELSVTLQSFAHTDDNHSRGTVVIVHGYMDHMGLYQKLITTLYKTGYDLLCYDLSGHGLSDGNPLAVDDFKHYATQLSELISKVGPSLKAPLHMIGQSTGAAVLIAHQLLFSSQSMPQQGVQVMLAPLIRPNLWRSIKRKFSLLKYVLKRVPRQYSQNSHDAAFIRFIEERDSLQHRQIPVSWIGAMLSWGDWIEQHPPVKGRVYMIQGTDDSTVDWQHNLGVMGRLYPDLDLTLIEQAKHHLVNESDRYRLQVFQRILQILAEWENKNGQP